MKDPSATESGKTTIHREDTAVDTLDRKNQMLTDTIAELNCNLDDMTAEAVAYAMEQLLAAGARDVFTVPIGMKKSRAATMLTVLCAPEQIEEMVRLMFQLTTTLGIRETLQRRYILDRTMETVQTPYGPVRFKIVQGYGTEREKPEYEDLARIAKERGISIREAELLVRACR